MNMQEVLDNYHVPYDTSGRGKNRLGWLNMKCPYCGRDPYLGYSIEGRAFSCWNSGRHPVAETLSLLCRISLSEAIELSRGLPSTYTPREQHKGKLELPPDLGPLLPAHKKYLVSRKLDPDKMVALWGLQGIGRLGGRYAWHIFIPVHVNGEIVTWTTRRITNHEPRYQSASPGQSTIPIDETLLGIDYCRTSCLCAEGPADVFAYGPGACCPFGLRVSDAQLETLSRFTLRGICFDAGPLESQAQRRARLLANKLSVMSGTTVRITLETGKDLGSCSNEELNLVRKEFLR